MPFDRTALLLIAHGSRQPEANADLSRLADELRQTGRFSHVEPAYLELAEPDIDAGAANCVRPGVRRVILLPYFLSAGVHVRRDLTAAQARLSTRFAGVEFALAEPLGPHPLLTEIVLQRVSEVG
jgi:sirohydrochlorin ferrochelatase